MSSTARYLRWLLPISRSIRKVSRGRGRLYKQGMCYSASTFVFFFVLVNTKIYHFASYYVYNHVCVCYTVFWKRKKTSKPECSSCKRFASSQWKNAHDESADCFVQYAHWMNRTILGHGHGACFQLTSDPSCFYSVTITWVSSHRAFDPICFSALR